MIHTKAIRDARLSLMSSKTMLSLTVSTLLLMPFLLNYHHNNAISNIITNAIVSNQVLLISTHDRQRQQKIRHSRRLTDEIGLGVEQQNQVIKKEMKMEIKEMDISSESDNSQSMSESQSLEEEGTNLSMIFIVVLIGAMLAAVLSALFKVWMSMMKENKNGDDYTFKGEDGANGVTSTREEIELV